MQQSKQQIMQHGLSRRQFLSLVGIGATATALAACAPVGQTSGQPAAASGVKLSHWQHHNAGRAAAVEAFKKNFEGDNPNVTIDFQSIPWADYWGKLASGIAAGKGSAPDIFQIPMGLVEEYIAGGNLLPVSELVTSAADIEKNYLPWTVQRGKQGSDYYGLPLDVQTLVMYRNNALYEEAGLDPTQPYTDHADLFAQAQKLTKKQVIKPIRLAVTPTITVLSRPFSSSNICNANKMEKCGSIPTATNWSGWIIQRFWRPLNGSVNSLPKRTMTLSSKANRALPWARWGWKLAIRLAEAA